jgi:hypothetical protein
MIASMISAKVGAMEVEVTGPGAFAVDVVGVSRRQDVLEAAAEHGAIHDALLILEDDNPHDDQAVRVEIGGRMCGYLKRDVARRYRENLAAAGNEHLTVRVKAKIIGGFETASGERAHFGLRLDLPPFGA